MIRNEYGAMMITREEADKQKAEIFADVKVLAEKWKMDCFIFAAPVVGDSGRTIFCHHGTPMQLDWTMRALCRETVPKLRRSNVWVCRMFRFLPRYWRMPHRFHPTVCNLLLRLTGERYFFSQEVSCPSPK